MSISDSLYIGISGLQATGNAISVVGDNIANASTVGFKAERAQFSDVLGSAFGAEQLGGGVRMSGTQTLFSQGSLQQTGNQMDMAIQGNGFFVVNGQHDGQTGNFFTRNGQFTLDNTGYAVDSNNLRLQGYTIDPTGQKSTVAGDLNLGSRQSPPAPTTKASIFLHLNSSDPSMNFDATTPATTSSYPTSETVYDSLGNQHQVQIYMVPKGASGTTNNYEWHAMVDGADVGGTKGTPVEIASGTLVFNQNGSLQSQATNASSASFNGATPNQAIAFNFGDDIASGGTGFNGTQDDAGQNGTISTSADGHAVGNLTSIAIASNGTITGTFDNGQRLDIAQVALATFGNNDGLHRAGDNLMTATNTSGAAAIDAAGANGRGAVSQGALESSNVDISTELVTLIAYQRAFEANSKTVTTADQMMQTVSQLKQ